MVIQKMTELGMGESSASDLETSQLGSINESTGAPIYANVNEEDTSNANVGGSGSSNDNEQTIIPVRSMME